MTNVADLAIRLLQNHLCVTRPGFDPELYDWESHEETAFDAFGLPDNEKATLFRLTLDLAVQFARTAEVALGANFANVVIRDWDGRGWKVHTERSGDVRPTVTALPGSQPREPWSIPLNDDPHGLSALEREALWGSLVMDVAPEAPPCEDSSPDDFDDAKVTSIEALRRRRESRINEPNS